MTVSFRCVHYCLRRNDSGTAMKTRTISFPHHAVLVVVLGAWVLPCVAAEKAAALQLPPQRISAQAIHADHGVYQATQARIKALNDKGVRVDDYALAKAQCWLDTSFHEYSRNDRGGYPQAALSEAAALIGALEEGRDPGMETPLVNRAEKLRPDLWARYDALKRSSGFRCAAQATACAEVELVHAGNEIHDGGWRHAKPYLQIAEDLTSRAEAQAAQCPAAAPAQALPPAPSERFDLDADALFAFDRGDLGGLLPQGKQALDGMVQRLTADYASIERIRLVGHSDRLGRQAYNQRLSEQRAWTIKQYLQQHGIAAPIQAEGVGAREPSAATAQCVGTRATPALTRCLQPDRRVSVEIVGRQREAR
ncbi:OmpA family protein [Xanthomonas sontii]|uniref:OmpA family protein n=2 Tax=Xanthomonas TaxID=338 RepID=A0A6N7QDX0_9XANT|nr:OmpA family protein [Xanthomonas sontii]MRH76828.1 OmpA family protein [Xanthomonas sontii]